MAINRHWALPLALVGGMAVGAALALRRRDERRHATKRQHKQDLHAWEDEGGNLATLETPHPVPEPRKDNQL